MAEPVRTIKERAENSARDGAGSPLARTHALGDDEARRVSLGIARGEPAALETLYGAWFDRAFGLARKCCGRDEAFCLDIVQEAFVRVIASLRGMDSAGALDGWMTRTVRSACVDALRRESRRLGRETKRRRTGADAMAAPEAGERDEALARVRSRLAELESEDAAAVRMRIGEGMGLKETAASTSTTASAVHGRVRRALAKLRRMLEGEES